MEKHQKLSLWVSVFALITSIVTAYFQYQTRQDAVQEKIKVEMKITLDKSPLNPFDLRVVSGVEERSGLEAAILVTNMGNTKARIAEVGYQDNEFPEFAFYADASGPRILSPGEQALFIVHDLVKIDHQLTDSFILGEEKNAKIFATSTKGNRFEALALIEVAK